MHLGIIMDGNRRWARSRFLPAIAGHKAGLDNAIKIVEVVNSKKIEYLTLWALSKENLLRRDEEELSGIMKLMEGLKDLLPKLQEKNIRFEVIGDIKMLPKNLQIMLNDVSRKTSKNSGMVLIVALVYSGQDEIIRAIKKLYNSNFDIKNLDEKSFRRFLDTANYPEPDLIIRTGGNIRHSGFFLYDSAYSEYFFTDKFWPDFDEYELDKALDFYNKSKRNFGR